MRLRLRHPTSLTVAATIGCAVAVGLASTRAARPRPEIDLGRPEVELDGLLGDFELEMLLGVLGDVEIEEFLDGELGVS